MKTHKFSAFFAGKLRIVETVIIALQNSSIGLGLKRRGRTATLCAAG